MPTSRNKPPKPPQNLPLLTPPPPSPSSFTFVTPVRKLIFARDLELFQASETHELLLTFVTDLNNSVINVPNSQQLESNAIVEALLAILDRVAEAIVEFPAEDAAGSRFGNKSFQLFYDAIWERAPGWHTDLGVIVAPPLDQDQILAAVNELSRYFCESFGNRSRIDYGSGHELNFLSWLQVFLSLFLFSLTDNKLE
jgi:serine/threonine-protein phosphatase 2A activator